MHRLKPVDLDSVALMYIKNPVYLDSVSFHRIKPVDLASLAFMHIIKPVDLDTVTLQKTKQQQTTNLLTV